MKTKHLILEFESYFSSTVKHTARVRYNVDFDTSSIQDTLAKLNQLKDNITTGKMNYVHVGLNITYADIEYIESLLLKIVDEYKEKVSQTLPPKTTSLLHGLKSAIESTPEQIAKEVIIEIIKPKKPVNRMTRKDKIKADAEVLSRAKALKTLQNSANSAKDNRK